NYCIIDVPQSLFFAELFLRINLPTANIQYLSDEIPKLSTEKQNIILVPIQNAHLVKKMGIDFDLGINSGSLGELSEKWVDFWMNWLDEAPCSQFYSLNYCGTPLTNWAEGANTMAPHLSKRWQYKLSRPASPVIAMQAGGGRYFCDLLAQKMPEGELPSEEELSHRYQILKKRSFSRQTYIYSLDIARQTNTVGILLDILMRCANEFPYLPLESHWILEKLNSLPHDFLPEEDRGKLSSIEATIKAQYQRALHDLV
ncbi:MAG: hypothetical protein K0U13_01655, partial [Chlamydiae bacterium]|nr:hypothetical protein [Chlamydiota bacterium]